MTVTSLTLFEVFKESLYLSQSYPLSFTFNSAIMKRRCIFSIFNPKLNFNTEAKKNTNKCWISPSFTVEWHGRKVIWSKERGGGGEWEREWNENDGINVKSPHYIDGFYSHSFFCFVGTDNSTVTTISIFGWEHIFALIETRRKWQKKGAQERMRKSIQLAIKANIKIIWY